MPEPRNLVTPISIAVAVVSLAWAIYATQHKPSAAGGPTPGAATRGGGPAFVSIAPVRSERVSQKLEALGNARANESVDISSKTSNVVTSIMFRDGERVRRGQVLVQLDDAQLRADVAAAEAAVAESERLYNRSRELMDTEALSKAQFDQLEATLKANRARLAAARARFEDSVIRAPFNGRVGLRRVSVGTLISPGDVITTLDDTSVIKLDFLGAGKFSLHAARRAGGARYRAGIPGPCLCRQGGEHRFARRPEHTLGDGACAAVQRRWRTASRHVPQRDARQR